MGEEEEGARRGGGGGGEDGQLDRRRGEKGDEV